MDQFWKMLQLQQMQQMQQFRQQMLMMQHQQLMLQQQNQQQLVLQQQNQQQILMMLTARQPLMPAIHGAGLAVTPFSSKFSQCEKKINKVEEQYDEDIEKEQIEAEGAKQDEEKKDEEEIEQHKEEGETEETVNEREIETEDPVKEDEAPRKKRKKQDDGGSLPKRKRSTRAGAAERAAITGEALLKESVIRDLNTVPPDMTVSTKDELKKMEMEAKTVLVLIKGTETFQHLLQVARGEIYRNADMMMGGGLGPFTLFENLREEVLTELEKFEEECSVHFITNVLLPEAIIYSYQKLRNCNWDEGLQLFLQRSEKVAVAAFCQ